MPRYALEGVPVEFPYEAYPCQLDYMASVIRALKQSTNAMLESPTGTGKTLCLLCATLAWRESLRSQQDPTADAGSVEIHGGGSRGVILPPIIYSSRTHSQLAQVMRELKNTSYKPRTAVLGSRTQMCLHHEVSQLSGAAANSACNALTSSRSCQYYNRVDDHKSRNPDMNKEPIDIEELVRIGQNNGPCPFFMAKEMAVNAELIFVPYNYLIDERARKSIASVEWHGAIVIFDEAHNVEGVCSDSFSMDITASNLAAAIQEVSRARELTLGQLENVLPVPSSVQQQPAEIDFGSRASELKMLAALLKKLETAISDFPIADGGTTRPGEFIFTLLDSLNINISTYEQMTEKMKEATEVLVDEALGAGRRRGAQVVNYKLSWLSDCFKSIFATLKSARPGLPPLHLGFRVHIHRQQARGGKGQSTPTLSFWCFNPGLSMNELANQGIRSILLTSGTLSPLASLTYELGLPFPVRLENPHVINPKQVYIGVVSKGPSGVALNSSYQCRDNPKYKSDLGNAIVNFARMTPDGLLVFFPSYRVLESCVEHWKNTVSDGSSIWDRLSRHKAPVVEPRDGAAFARAAEEFQANLDSPTTSGAVFFAVCRGKVSEGLDFSDRAGRAVIITGIPYPMKMDPKVRLKQNVLDEEAAKLRKAGKGSQALGGSQWYSQQALRAVNQALGRVIRHRQDYGAILLLDERFAAPNTRQQLSKWLRDKVADPPNFGAAAGSVQRFFKEMHSDPELQARAARPRNQPPSERSSGGAGPSAGSGASAPGPVSTHGIAHLGKSMLVSALPAAVDTVCPVSSTRTSLFARPGGSRGQQGEASAPSTSSRLLGFLGNSGAPDGGSKADLAGRQPGLTLGSLLHKVEGSTKPDPGGTQPAGSTRASADGSSYLDPPRGSKLLMLGGGAKAPPAPSNPTRTVINQPPHRSGDQKSGRAGKPLLEVQPQAAKGAPAPAAKQPLSHRQGAGQASKAEAGVPKDNPPPKPQQQPGSSHGGAARPATAPAAPPKRSREADQPATSAQQAAEYMTKLKLILLRPQYLQLTEAMKAYKKHQMTQLQLVDVVVEVLPPGEVEGMRPFLGSRGNAILQEKLRRADTMGQPPGERSAGGAARALPPSKAPRR